ncbi:hypothetical protein RJ640_029290 [Escallonia rubra]|uniref:Cytochrome P450 n=1 Tax=Escallonia rubra TaxID=112253 RepID=A0AA88QZ39_9ASTE|nr:hypothetical protein RJ640_029290 [Escallonia rubra]
MGTSTSVVVSNAAVAREVLKTNYLNFAFRPEFGAGEYDIYKDCSFFIAPYGKFLENQNKLHLATKAQNLEYVPFGSEGRACPGSGLAQSVMYEMIGALVQCFDFKAEGEEKVDMKEGVAADKAHPLVCFPTMHTSPQRLLLLPNEFKEISNQQGERRKC